MRTPRILSHSIVALLLLAPFASEASPDTLSGVSPAWATGSNWSLGVAPGIGDNAIIAATGLVNVNGTDLGGLRELQDLTFNALGTVTLANVSSATAMVLALNGGRGAGVPLIQTLGNVAYTIQGPGTGAPSNPLGIQLNASGSISVGSTDQSLGLTISSVISQSGGARSLSKTGTGRLRLSGANTYSGGMTVSDGILEVASNGALGTGAAVINGGTVEINQANTTLSASSLTVNTGARIAVRNGAILSSAVALAGGTLTTHETGTGIFAGAVSVTGNSFADLRSYLDPATDLDVTVGGLLSGSSSLTINGNGSGGKALILTNTGNTFSGNFFVNSGQTLRGLPTTTGKTIGTGTINLSGGTIQVRDNGTGSNQVFTYGNPIVVQSGGGTIDVSRASGANQFNTVSFGALTIGQETLNFTGGGSYRVAVGPVTLTGAPTFDVSSTLNRTDLSGIVSGAFGLTKTGAGLLRMQAANSYMGQTNVNAGTLQLTSAGGIASSPQINVATNAIFDVASVTGGFKLGGAQTLSGSGLVRAGSVATGFTVQNGGTIVPGGSSGSGTLSMTVLSLGLAAGDLASINFISPGTFTLPLLNVSTTNGLVANGGANSVTINISGGTPDAATYPATYPLITYLGTVGGTGSGAFKLGTLPPRVASASLVHNPGVSPPRFDLVVQSIDFPIWKGARSNEWSNNVLASPKNWVLNSNNATSTDFLVNDNVSFTDIATRTTVDISVTDVAPKSVTFNNTTKDFTITGIRAIAGVGGLTKNGTGKVTIENTNTFTGPVTLNAGTLSVYELADVTMPSGIGAGSSLTFNGGTLEFLGSFGSTNRPVSLLVGGGTVRNDLDLSLAGMISGAGTLTKVGDGILSLVATNTHASTTISGGTLEVAASGALGSGAVTNNATLSFNGFSAITVNNLIQGSGTVKQVGFGTVTFGGMTSNTYTGVTEISNGVLIAGKPALITAIPGDLVINSGGAFRYLNNNVSDQIADTASITLNPGGSFGDPNNTAPTNPGATDTVANVTVNGGTFGSGRNATIGPFTITGTLHVFGGGVANAQRGGIISAQTVQIDDGSVNLDGGSGTPNNQSRLDVGAGGLHLAGGTINFNIGGVAPGSVGSILNLGGDVTSSGDSFFIHSIAGVANAVVDLRGAARTFEVEGTLQIGTADAPIAIQNGSLTKTGTGTLILGGTGTFNLDAEDGEVIFAANQTLGALSIGSDGIVRLGAAGPAPALADEMLVESGVASITDEILAGPAQAIPEPNLTALLLLGATALIGRRRRE